jgi:hypothetical protein
MAKKTNIELLRDSIREQFSTGLRGARDRAKISQSELVTLSQGVSKQNITKYETGKAIPALMHTLPYLLDALDCDITIKITPRNSSKAAAKRALL